MSLITKWRWRLQHGGNLNIMFVGNPRSGKSYSSCWIAKQIDPNFTVDNIAWTIPQFVRLLANPRIKEGACIVFDEAGVGIHNRTWYLKLNEQAINILQTYGFKNIAVVFTAPSFDFIDVQARKLFHYYLETVTKDVIRKRVKCKVRIVRYLPNSGKYYYVKPIVEHKGEKRKVNFWYIPKPDDELAAAYDLESERWKRQLIQESKKMINEIDKNNAKEFNPNHFAKQLLKVTDKVTIAYIENKFKLGDHQARRVLAEYRTRLARAAEQAILK